MGGGVVSCRPSYGFRGLIPGERAEMNAARMMTCPKCHQFVDNVSEHQLFVMDLIAVRCSDCNLASLGGANYWVQYPSVREFAEPGWKEAQEKADQEFSELIRAAAYAVAPVNDQPMPGDIMAIINNVEHITKALASMNDENHHTRFTDSGGISMGGTIHVPTKGPKPETWHDREPLL
jgi:hypothetical protein